MQSLQGQLLIAMPMLQDFHFYHAVILICEHNQEGAMGLVINHPDELQLRDILSNEDNTYSVPGLLEPVYRGGPVEPERGFILHDDPQEWKATTKITEDIYLTTSRDLLDAMASGNVPGNQLVTLGYAGWAGGQLEEELIDNAWLVAPVKTDILFHTPPGQRWHKSLELIGVDPARISHISGKA